MSTSSGKVESQKPFVIRDPVHGYLRVAAHERVVVDHPITQRLRHVLQTGLAHLVFPEARTSRFSHSMGAMHLASRFLIASIENASDDTARALFEELESIVNKESYGFTLEEIDTLFAEDARSGQGPCGLSAWRAILTGRSIGRDEQSARRLLGFAEGGLRLAALFHDLGHLPFSHDFEYALREYVGSLPPKKRPSSKLIGRTPHEEIGHRLAHLVFKHLAIDQKPAARAMYGLAKKILDADKTCDHASAVQWLHSLVDGDLDADRADYLLRDARALSFEFAAYDLERLIANTVVVNHKAYGFVTVVREQAVGALESFLVSRARSNQFLVRHHKVAQAGVALRYCARAAFDEPEGKAFLQDLYALTEEPGSKEAALKVLVNYAKYDDAWFLGVLRKMDAGECPPLLKACLGLVLRRENSLESIWKRKGNLSAAELRALNARLSKYGAEGAENLDEQRRDLEKHGVLLAIHRFRPYELAARVAADHESLLQIATVRGELEPLSKISPLVQSLWRSWEEDLKIHAFRARQLDSRDQLAKEDIFRKLSASKPKLGASKPPSSRPAARPRKNA